MNDNVVDFPGATVGKINPNAIIQHLVESEPEIESILAVGFLKNGAFFLTTSEGEIKENMWIIENAKMNFRDFMVEDDW